MKNIIERIVGGGAKIARYLPKAVSMRLAVAVLAAIAAGGAGASVTADAVWEGGFADGSTKTGASGITYTLNLRGNTSDATGATLPITAATGAQIALSDSSANLAVLVKYSALASAPNQKYELAAIRVKGKGWPGLRIATAGAYNLTGFYEDSAEQTYNLSATPKLSSSGGYFLLCHQGGSKTGGYAGPALTQLLGGESTDLKWGGGTTLDTIVLGGPSPLSGVATPAYNGLVIEKVAIFNRAVTGADLATYAFPSEDPTTTYDYVATITSNTSFGDITTWTKGAGTPGTDAKVYIISQNNAVLSIDGSLDVGTLLVDGGSIAPADGASISSTEISGAQITMASGRTVAISDSVLNSAISMPGGTINFTDCEINGGLTAEQNGNATINTAGEVSFSGYGENDFRFSTTFCIKSGITTYNSKSSAKLWCTVQVEKGATLVNERQDSFNHGALVGWPIHARIYGTLTLNKKWNVAGGNYIHLYNDATINGSAANALHFNVKDSEGKIIAETGTSAITAPIAKGIGTISVQTKEGAILEISSSTALAKSGPGTLRIKNTDLTSDISGSEGVLELYNDSGSNKTHYNTISFSGMLKVTRENSSKSHNVFGNGTEVTATTGQDLVLTGMPKLEVAGSYAYLCLNAQLANQNLSVKNLTYEGDSSDAKVDPVYNDGTSSGNMSQIKTIKTMQTEDTICNLIFNGESNGGKRQSALYVYGDAGAVHSLTLTKESTTFGPLTVENYGKVIFSGSGKWANGTVTVGVNGVLEAQHTAALGVVTLQDGATIVVPTVSSAVVPLTGTTVTLPTSGTVYVDLTGVSVAEGETVTVISATTLENANASIFHQTEGGWRFSVDNNTIKATKLGTDAWSDGTWSDSDLTGYASASITASGTQDVTLPTSATFDTLTITGSGSITLKSTSSETCTVAALSIGAGVTLNASSSLVLAEGCAITGEGVLNIPANTTFAMNGVTCSTVSISGTGAISVPESTICSMEDVSLTGTTISGEGIISVPANTTCSMTNVTCSAKIIVAGTLATSGTTTLSGQNESTGTINVTGGVTTATFRGQYLEGTVNIASGAELVLPSSNPIFYNSRSSINIVVKGTLTVNNTMTIGTNTPISLYPGAIVRGSGLLSLGGNESTASTIQMIAQGGDASGIATISCRISTSDYSSGAKIIVEDGVTLACSGTMSGANSIAKQGQGSLTIDAGTMVSTVEPTGQVTINENATFELKDCAWTSNVFSGSGTLYLHHTNTETDRYNHSVSGSSFSGRLKIDTPSGKKAYFNDNPEIQLTGRPELVLELGTQGEQGQLWVGGRAKDKYFRVKNLSGWGYVVPWSNVGGVHYFETVQNANTEFSGVFADWNGSAIGTGNYKTGLTVKGGDTVKSLTLTAANTTTGPLAIQDSGKVIFSGSGDWAAGTVVVGANGYLESSSSAATLASTLTLQDGATMTFVPNKMVTVTTLNLPSEEGETVTFDINYVPALEGTTLISSSSITANTDVGMIECENAIIKAEEGAIKAYPVATVTTYGSDAVVAYSSVQEAINNARAENGQYVTAYQSETVTTAGQILLKIDGGAVVTLKSSKAGCAYDVGKSIGEGIYMFSDNVQVAATFKWKTAVASGSWSVADNWTSDDGTVSRIPGSLDTVIFESDAMVETPVSGFSFAALQANASVTIKRDKLAIDDRLTRTVSAYGAISGTGSLTLNDGVNLANASDASLSIGVPVTVAGATALTVAEGVAASFTGSGTLTLDALTSTSIVGDGWTGTVVLPALTANEEYNFNAYGVSGSTVRLAGGFSAGWLANAAVNPAIEIPSGQTLTLGSFSPSYANAFAALKGDGTFAITAVANQANDLANVSNWGSGYDHYSAYFRIGDVSGFHGSITTTSDVGVVLGSSKPSKNTPGGKILVYGNVTVGETATWTAPNGVILADANATLVVPSGATVPAPTTTVPRHVVKATTVDGTTTYSVVAKGFFFMTY